MATMLETEIDVIEWAAVRRGNGFRHGRAGRNGPDGNPAAHGLPPEHNGAGCYHAIKHLVIAMLIASTGCTAGTRRHVNRATLGASMAALACDWAQTRSVAADGWSGGRTEANPIMGERPATALVDVYFAGAAIVTAAAWHALPERWRSAVPAVVIGVQVDPIASNVRSTATVCGVRL